MLMPTTRKRFSPRPLQCVITALSPFWLQLGANTVSQSLRLPNMVHFLASQLRLKTKNYQFWVSLLWISHLQFWCTEGKLVPTSNLPLQSGSSLPIHLFQPTWSLLSFSPLADSGSGLPQADLLKLPFHLYLLCFPWKQSNLARVHTWRNHILRTQVQIPEQKNEIDDLIPPMSSKPLRTHQQAPSMPASTEKKTKRKELGVGPICLWVQQPSVKNTAGGEKTSSSYTPLSLKSTAKHSWPRSTPREGHLKCTYYTTMWEPTEPAHTPTHCYTVYILHTLTPRCGCL